MFVSLIKEIIWVVEEGIEYFWNLGRERINFKLFLIEKVFLVFIEWELYLKCEFWVIIDRG